MKHRIYNVTPQEAGRSLIDWLRTRLGISRPKVMQLLRGRQIRVAGNPCSNPEWKLRAGQRVEVPTTGQSSSKNPPPSSPQPRNDHAEKILSQIAIRHVDDDLLIVEKPAGLTTMRHPEEAAEFGRRGRRYLPDTLADYLPTLVARRLKKPAGKIIPVHRIDKDTTGLVVFARTPEAEQHLGQQFRKHTIERVYQALVRGKAVDAMHESWIVRDRGDGRRGSGPQGEGQHAVTHVRVLEVLGDFSLVECRLETGRTHQVRIHLGEAGTPLCGERIYDRPLHGRPHPDKSGIGRVALHAAILGLDHPRTKERRVWNSDLPPDMSDLLDRLKRQMLR